MKSKKKSFMKIIPKGKLALFFTILIFFTLTLIPASAQFEWGADIDAVKKSLGGDGNFKQFTPRQKPDYENKIINYITAVDEGVIEKIIILQTNSAPITDYLFVNNKLYTSLEDWGDIDSAKHTSLKNKLDSQYGTPSLQQDGSISVYSYSDSKTKVIFYSKKVSGTKYSCRVYFYAKQLFRLLIVQ